MKLVDIEAGGCVAVKRCRFVVVSVEQEPHLDTALRGCDECFEKLDVFVDLTLAGKTAAEALPLVHDHLERCSNCREEFHALLAALQSVG